MGRISIVIFSLFLFACPVKDMSAVKLLMKKCRTYCKEKHPSAVATNFTTKSFTSLGDQEVFGVCACYGRRGKLASYVLSEQDLGGVSGIESSR